MSLEQSLSRRQSLKIFALLAVCGTLPACWGKAGQIVLLLDWKAIEKFISVIVTRRPGGTGLYLAVITAIVEGIKAVLSMDLKPEQAEDLRSKKAKLFLQTGNGSLQEVQVEFE